MKNEQETEKGKERECQSSDLYLGDCGEPSSLSQKSVDDKKQDYNVALNYAEAGNPSYMVKLARYYFYGIGVERDYNQAVNWLEKAAKLCHFGAQVILTDYYLEGPDAIKNYNQAVKWLKKIVGYTGLPKQKLPFEYDAQQIQLDAQCKLAYCYFNGYGVEKNPVKAVTWLKKAALQGYAPAQIKLSDCYEQGVGVAKDPIQSVEWLEKAAGLLEIPIEGVNNQMYYFERNANYDAQRIAQVKLGSIYLKNENYLEAIKYYKGSLELIDINSSLKIFKDNELGKVNAILGICYYYTNETALALDALKKAVDNNYEIGYLWIGFINHLHSKLTYLERISKYVNSHAYLPKYIGGFSSRFQPDGKISLECPYEEKISDSLHQWAFHFFQDMENFFDDDLINSFFPSEVINFLDDNKYSPAKVILAIYYRDNENEKLKYLRQASSNNDMLADFILGKHYQYKGSLDKAIQYFEKINEHRKLKLSPSEKTISTENGYSLLIQAFLFYSAKEELSNVKHQMELEEKNKELESSNEGLNSANHRMQSLVEQFTHTLGNVIFPDTIYQVAERLKNNPECRKDALLLHEAYHSEITIKLQGELLRQRYGNSNPEKFRQIVRRCRRSQNDVDKTKSIETILDYAASRVTARFLNQHYAGLTSIRDKILSKKKTTLDVLKKKFEDDILLNTSLTPIAWINQNLRPIKIAEISPLWKMVFILSESHAEALLFGYFSEILFNAFKYADHDKDDFLTIAFSEKTTNDKTYLSCSWVNPVKEKTLVIQGTGKGLNAIQEDLKQLNNTENPEESLLIYQKNNKFQVTFFFKEDILYTKPVSEEDLNLFL